MKCRRAELIGPFSKVTWAAKCKLLAHVGTKDPPITISSRTFGLLLERRVSIKRVLCASFARGFGNRGEKHADVFADWEWSSLYHQQNGEKINGSRVSAAFPIVFLARIFRFARLPTRSDFQTSNLPADTKRLTRWLSVRVFPIQQVPASWKS